MSDNPFSRLARSVDELIFQRDQWKIEAGRLKAERDAARREALMWLRERCSAAELTQEIKKRGWEYLKENET